MDGGGEGVGRAEERARSGGCVVKEGTGDDGREADSLTGLPAGTACATPSIYTRPRRRGGDRPAAETAAPWPAGGGAWRRGLKVWPSDIAAVAALW